MKVKLVTLNLQGRFKVKIAMVKRKLTVVEF